MDKRPILNETLISITLTRLAHQLIENHHDFKNSVIIGLQPRGVAVAKRILELLKSQGIENIPYGSLDITFFRDDFRRRDKPLKANQTKIDFLVEDKKVIFIDDVLYTGRSVRSAMDAIQSFGRPRSIELLVLINRRFSRDLPIQADYIGHEVDAIATEKVLVEWQEEVGIDRVTLINQGE